MSDLKHTCPHCNGHIAFPPEALGTAVQCPHCANQTVLSTLEDSAAQPELQPLPPKPLHEAVDAGEHTSAVAPESTSTENYWGHEAVDAGEYTSAVAPESTSTENYWGNVIGQGVFAAINTGLFTYNLMWAVKNTETYIWMSVQFILAVACIGSIFAQTLRRQTLPIGFAITGVSLIIGGAVGFFSTSSSARDFIQYSEQIVALAEIESRAIAPMESLESKTDAEALVVLRDTVIPNYENFFTKLQEIPADNDELRPLHNLYVDGAQQQLSGMRGMEKALLNQDVAALKAAIETLSRGRQMIEGWAPAFNGLKKKHGLQ